MTLVTSTTVLGSLIDELEVFVKARELVQRATSFEPGFSSPSSPLALLRSTRHIARYDSLATPSQRQRLTTVPWLRTYGELH